MICVFIVSIMFFGATLGNLLSFPLADLLGRRRTLMFAAAALAAGWAALAAAQDLTLLLTGRMVAGVAFGVLDPCSYLWLSEITLIRFRGVLGVLNLLVTCFFVQQVMVVSNYCLGNLFL